VSSEAVRNTLRDRLSLASLLWAAALREFRPKFRARVRAYAEELDAAPLTQHSARRRRVRRAQHDRHLTTICSCTWRVQVLCCHHIISWAVRRESYSMPPRSARSKAGSRNIEKAPQGVRKHRKLVCVAVLNTDCVVCLNEQRSHIFGPCGHYCVCPECCETIMNSSQSCPLCRSACVLSMRVFS
jgi:hypothetical protein